ncbi:CU044_5270 family protein [Spirillospora sp. NPDC048911]|uniref:CU044_5270 family protein n=1 Tax=Spirillospora sp. NPDC048911 TaxID=3364527 RepID=UPI00371E2420
MDELDALREMRTTLAREENSEQLAMRVGWRADVSSQRRRRALKLPPSFKLPLVSLAAVTAVAAGAVAVLTLPSDSAGTGTGGPGKTGAGPVPGNALLVAATSAEKGKTGKYWHSRLIEGEIFAAGKSAADHYKIVSLQRYEGWAAQDGNGWWGDQDLPARPWTPQDKQKWQAAGSPSRLEVPSAEGPVTMFLKNSNTGLSVRPSPPNDDGVFYGLTQKQFVALPAEPARLQNALLNLKGHWRAYQANGPEEPMRALRGKARSRALSDVAESLLSTAPTPPALRAATYRMLAALPGVKAEGTTTDPLGRTGTAISLPVDSTVPLGLYTAPKQLGTYRRQWIIDPGTGALLAVRDLVVTPPRGSRKLPPGDNGKPRSLRVKDMPDRFHKPGEIASYKVFELGEWTDTGPKLPPQ